MMGIHDVKDDGGWPRLDLIPPLPLMSLGEVLAHGAKKYAPNQWMMVPDGRDRFYAAALCRLLARKDGQESGLPHLGHAMANVMFLHGLGRYGGGAAAPPDGPAPAWMGAPEAPVASAKASGTGRPDGRHDPFAPV
jgi:hypothetical protein